MDNIPFLSFINRSGISTVRFFVLIGVGTFCVASLLAYIGLAAPEVLGLDPVFLPAVTFVVTFLGGALLCFSLYLLRSSTGDIQKLIRDYPKIAERVNTAQITRRTQCLILLVIAGIYYGFLLSSEFSMFPDRTLLERWEVITGRRIPVMLYFLATPLLTFGAWLFTLVFWQQLRALVLLAKILPLQISQLFKYQQISDPFVRLVVVFSFLSTLFPVALLLSDDAPKEAIFATIAVFVNFVALSALYFIPVAIVRSRIHELLSHAQIALAEEMKGENFTAPEYERLMLRQMYLESRWEWPLASNVQKIIVFVLLPPLAWIMAAVVENLLF